MKHSKLGWIVVLLAAATGGWLAFDGAHALITGDYVTPSRGAYAGQLGPWANFVEEIGIEPRSLEMKLVHVGLGLAWLASIVVYVRGRRWGWALMLACAIAALWYMPFGTLFGAVQIALLLSPRLRPLPADGG